MFRGIIFENMLGILSLLFSNLILIKATKMLIFISCICFRSSFTFFVNYFYIMLL